MFHILFIYLFVIYTKILYNLTYVYKIVIYIFYTDNYCDTYELNKVHLK